MSYVIAAPEALVAAATDLATLGSTIGAANAAAAGSTTALLTAGADEVSAAIAAYSECTARPIRHSVRGRRRSMSGSCRPWPQVGRLCGRRGRQRLAAAERARFAECAHSGAVGASVGGQWRQWGPGDWGKRRRWRDFVRVRGGRLPSGLAAACARATLVARAMRVEHAQCRVVDLDVVVTVEVAVAFAGVATATARAGPAKVPTTPG